jgi:hypothetical protein
MKSLARAIALLLFLSSAAAAATIDFTSTIFKPAKGEKSYSFSPLTGLEGVGLTLSALPAGAKLYWDKKDGLGVNYFYQKDEIEFPEVLKIDFSENVYLSKISITDLFFERGYQEKGYYSLNGGSWVPFLADMAQTPGLSNGELTLSFTSPLLLDYICFTAPGLVLFPSPQSHEFSVAGLEVTAVPLPPAAWMLGAGLVGVVALRRRRR